MVRGVDGTRGGRIVSFGFLPSWHDILPREGGHVVTLRGAGGKTRFIQAMTGVLRSENLSVAVARDGADESLDWPGLVRSLPTDLPADDPLLHVVAADGGTGGLTPTEVDELGGVLQDHVLFYETASGVGRHRVGETAATLPARTSLLVTVCDLGVVGHTADSVFGPDAPIPASWLTPHDDRSVWSWDGLVAWLGAQTACPEGAATPPPQLVVLLGMDECLDSIGLFACVGRLMDELEIPLVIMGDTSGPEPRLRSAYTLAPDVSA